MHIQNTAGNTQPHLSTDLHSDTESKETDVPQHITKKMQRTRQWIKTGELFPKPTVGLAEDPKTLLSHLKHLSEDLANTHVARNTNVTQTLDHLIKHAQALTTIAGHDSAKTVLTHPDTLTSLNGALQQCDRQMQILDKSANYKKQHHEKLHHETPTREKLTELENLLGEVKVHITKQALSEVKVPGVDVISDMYAISECIDDGIWTHNNGEQRSVPQFSAYARNAEFSCQKLNQHLHERPGDIHQIQQHLPVGLNEILSRAFRQIERIATGCPDPLARHALASLASSIQKLSSTTVSDSTALEPGENSQSGAGVADKSAQQNPLLHRLAMKTDIYTAISPQKDKEFKQILRQDLSTTIDQWNAHNDSLPRILDQGNFPPKLKKRLLEQCANISHDLKAMKNGIPVKERLLRSAATLLTYPLALAIPLYTGEKQYSSTLIPHFAKNALLLLGLANNDTSGKQVYENHFNNRLFINTLISGIYAIPTFLKPAEFLRHNIGFNVGAATAVGMGTFAQFNKDKTKDIMDKVQSIIFGSDDKNFTINDNAKTELRDFVQQLQQEKGTLSAMREGFTQNGNKELSDTLNYQVSHVLSLMDKLSLDLKNVMGESAPVSSANNQNADFYPKLGLTALTAVIGAATVGLMYPDPIGMVDYVVDGATMTSEMWKQMINPNVDTQGAVKTLKDLVGLNLTMTLYLGVNKGVNFLDKGAAGYWSGTAAMTAANLTVPGIVGEAAGNAIGQILGSLQNKWSGGNKTPPTVELEEIVIDNGQLSEASAGSKITEITEITEEEPELTEIVIDPRH